MATFDRILQDKRLIRVVIRLRHGEFNDRRFYAYPRCLEWMNSVVPTLVTGRLQSDLTPAEQLMTRLRQWITGKPMAYGRMFQDLMPPKDEVWELKTADLRIFGWMYRPREFIAVLGGYADDYKEPTKRKNYEDDRRAVVAAREALPLDGQKYVTGEFDELV